MIKTCLHCGTEFESRQHSPNHRRGIYCSKACVAQGRRTIIKKICKICGKEFITKYKKRIVCSVNCRHKIFIKNKINTCKFCGKGFKAPTKKTHKVYCSSECFAQGRFKYKPHYCIICDGEIKHSKQAKYCSRECFNKRERKYKKEEGICPFCYNVFTKQHKTQKYCSKPCILRYYWQENDLGKSYQGKKNALLDKDPRCSICGYDKIPGILQLHHKDRNSKNNKPENIALACPNCHEEDHYLNRDGRYASNNSKKT